MSREKSRSTVHLEFHGGLSQQSSAASKAVWGDQSRQGLVSSVPFCFAVSCECHLKFSQVRGKFITCSSFPEGPQCLDYILLPDFWFLICYMAPTLREPQTHGTWISLVPLKCLVVFCLRSSQCDILLTRLTWSCFPLGTTCHWGLSHASHSPRAFSSLASELWQACAES